MCLFELESSAESDREMYETLTLYDDPFIKLNSYQNCACGSHA